MTDSTQHTIAFVVAGCAVSVTSDIDPLTLNGGGVLPPAAYQVVLEVTGLGWGSLAQSPLQGNVDLPAVLGDTLVSVRDIPKSGLHIDVNTQQRSLLGSINPADCTVAEDARGSLLTMQVPGLAGRGKNPIEGTVVLGGLPFPAKLIMSDPPRVECYVSGLPGTVEIKTRIGQSTASATGCELVTLMDGRFMVRKLTGVTAARIATTVATAISPLAAARAASASAAGPAPSDVGDSVTARVESMAARVEASAARVEATAARVESLAGKVESAVVKIEAAGTRDHPVTDDRSKLREALKRVPGLRPVVRRARRTFKQVKRRSPGRV